jgi:hypothetical protein
VRLMGETDSADLRNPALDARGLRTWRRAVRAGVRQRGKRRA